MTKNAFDAFSVIQRHADERTQVVGLELAEREFPGASIATVAAGDFPATLRACFEAAVDLDRPWTVTLDGDVLLLPRAGPAIAKLAATLPSDVGQAYLLVQDRVTDEARGAGVRLYRTTTMGAALAEGDWSGKLRPETHLLDSLIDVKQAASAVLVGLHDHEQYLRDLFRTALVMVRKKENQRERLVRLWNERDEAPDYRALLAGAAAAQRADIPFAIDAAATRSLADSALASAGLVEKSPLLRTPNAVELERAVPLAAQRLRKTSFGTRRFPHVARKAGNGARGLPLARYAMERIRAAAFNR